MVQQVNRRFVAAAVVVASVLVSSAARAAEPITIGFGMALTGGLAAAGKSALLAMQIWQDDVNAKGGLLGRPVKLIYYDDQSNPATVPGIYTKLLDVDKVDLIVSGYGTNMIAPAMPVAIEHDRLFLGLFGLAVNSEFHYPKYFSMLPTGPDPKHAFSRALLQGRDGGEPEAENPGPRSPTMPNFRRTPPKAYATSPSLPGSKIVYDKTLPAGDAGLHADRPRDPGDQSRDGVRRLLPAGLGRHAARGDRDRAQDAVFRRRHGRAAIHPGQAAIRTEAQRHRRLRLVDPGADDAVPRDSRVPEGIPGEGAEAEASTRWAGTCRPSPMPTCRCWAKRSKAPRASTRTSVADYIRSHPFKTIVGDISFGKDGEWAKPRVLEVQWQNIKSNNIDEFKDTKTEVILEPAEYRTGSVIAPYNGSGE